MALALKDVKQDDVESAVKYAEERMKARDWDPHVEQMLTQIMTDPAKADELTDRLDELVEKYKIDSGV